MSTCVTLYIRIRTADGRHPYMKPVYGNNRRLKPQYALVDGKAEHHPEGVYHLRYIRNGKRVWEAVGAEPAQAVASMSRREKILAAIAAGADVREPEKPVREQKSQRPLAGAIYEYLGDVAKYKAESTYVAYRLALETFLKSCAKEETAMADRRDILTYIDAMRDEGMSDRAQFNRVRYVPTFFKRQGRPKLIDAHEMPSYTEKLVAVYSKRNLNTLFRACSTEENDLFQFFLGSGCRDNEVVHACWENVDFDGYTYSVRAKDEYGFRPKNKEEREIPLSDALIALLRERRRRHPDSRLIFPREDGQPDQHLLRILKDVALRAELNCGQCVSGNGQTCREAPVCGSWQLHSFRRTFATMHATAGVKLNEISKWCGHASLETTQIYIASTTSRSDEVRRWVNGTFANLIETSV